VPYSVRYTRAAAADIEAAISRYAQRPITIGIPIDLYRVAV